MTTPGTPRPIVIMGPTATGKSDLALVIARRIGGIVIGADAVQVYRGLDAGSCKPSPAARAEVTHELIDVADPREPFSAGEFARRAAEAMARSQRAGRVPVVAGGTGLYLRALLHGIAPMPPRDEAVRRRLYDRAAATSSESLHDDLASLDPEAAARIGRRDLQRIVRAIEVAEVSGRSLSEHIRQKSFEPGAIPATLAGLTMARDLLYERIDRRVDLIFEAGLVEEVRGLLAAGVPPTANALKALGYREVLAHLRGEIGLEATRTLVRRNTRRYARRQIAWFRREPCVHWFDAGGGADRIAEIAEQLMQIHAAESEAEAGGPGDRDDG